MTDFMNVQNQNVQKTGDFTVNTPYEDPDKSIKVEDFLMLMVAQLQNQDFMNPVDDAEYMTQMAQFSMMTSMEEMNKLSQNAYAANMVGKTVTVATMEPGGKVTKDTGVVSQLSLVNGEFLITVNDKQYRLNQIMTINETGYTPDDGLEGANNLPLNVTDVTSNGAKLSWKAPNGQDGLLYDVYYTTNSNVDFNDLKAVKKGTLAASGISADSYALKGLDANKTYFVNVVVRNKNGEEAVYQRALLTTKS